MGKMKSVGFFSPEGKSNLLKKEELYKKEKELIKEEFKQRGNILNWRDASIQDMLNSFARKVIETSIDVSKDIDIIPSLLPTEEIDPGDTFVWHELYGAQVWYGTYGAAARLSRPMLREYTATTNLKEVGLKLDLTQIQTGKYSPSELGEFTAALINAWRQRLLFTNTLNGNSVYSSGGAQYVTGAGVGTATILTSLETLSEESDAKVIVARRKGVNYLSNQSSFSNETKREFEQQGQAGSIFGVPILKVNTFVDPLYGTVYPFPDNDIYIFSQLPAGRFVRASQVQTDNETIPSNQTMNMYFRWDDGIGIFKTDRIVRIHAT